MEKLTIAAPRREWYCTDSGWASRPWTKDAMAEAESGGAWFSEHGHDFMGDDLAEAIAAIR